MTKPINLNRVRKERASAKKRTEADANAAKFGRTKDQKQVEKADRKRSENNLDAHRLEARPLFPLGKADGGKGQA